jgi:hypothetical protein
MSKSNDFEGQLLDLIFLNTNIANLGDATGLRGSTVAGQLFLSLHTADPGEIGQQATNECNYTGYARVGVARSGAGFSRALNVVSLVATQSFPNPTNLTNLPQTATHFALGVASSGATVVCYKGAVTPNIVISNTGSTPQLGTGTQVTED